MQPKSSNYWEAKLRIDRINPSNLCISQKAHRPKVGQLLVGANIISPNVLTDCIDESRLSQQKLGDVLVDRGCVQHRDMRSALLAQSLISDGVLGENAAIKMLERAATNSAELVDEINQNSLEQDSAVDPDQFGLAQLLIEANFAAPEVIEEAKKRSAVSGILLGRALLLMNAMTAELLDSALLAISLVRDGKISQADAVKVLKESRRSKIGVEEAAENLNLAPKRRQKSITLGRICVEAKLIDEFECLASLEKALTEQRKVGEVLVSSGLVSEKPLRLALLLQGLAQLGVISMEQAAQVLQTMEKDANVTFTKVAADMGLFAAETTDENAMVFLLRTAGVISKQDIFDAAEKFASYQMCTTKALLASTVINIQTYKTCITCVKAVKEQEFSLQDAVKIMQLCHFSGFDYIEAFSQILDEKRRSQTAAAPSKATNPMREMLQVPEYKQAAIAVAILAVTATGVHLFCPPAFMFWALWTVFVGVAVVLFRAGRSHANREVAQEMEKSVRLSQAKLTKLRLASKRNR